MGNTSEPEEYLTAIDYDKNGEVLSGVVMGTSWSDVFQYRLDEYKETYG